MQRRSIGLIFLLAVSCQTPPKMGGLERSPALSEADAQKHFDAARAVLGDAYFDHRDDVDDVALRRHASELGAFRDLSPRWSSRFAYLMARSEALRGNYTNALESKGRARDALDPELADELNALAPYWKAMRYAQGEAALDYSQDAQVREPAGIVAERPALATPHGKRLFEQSEALFQNALVIAIGGGRQQRQPMFGDLQASSDAKLRDAFCAEPERGCPEAALLSARSAVAVRNRDDAQRLALGAAEGFRVQGRRALEIMARLLACDAAIVATGDPFDLGLFPLAGMETTMALNSGQPVPEHALPSAEAIATARACYAAASSGIEAMPARVRAEQHVRQAYLAWAETRYADAVEAFSAAEELLDATGEWRASFRAIVAQACAGLLEGGAVRDIRGALHGRLDDGVIMGAERLIERVALFAQHARYDVRAGNAAFGVAVELARHRSHSQQLGILLGGQAALLGSLGQRREQLLLLEEASGLHGPYRDAIPKITLLSSDEDRARARGSSLLMEYDQVLSLVQGYMELGDMAAATSANARLRELEAQGAVADSVVAPRNDVLLAFYEGDYARALELARAIKDAGLEALALVFNQRFDEATALVQELVKAALEHTAPLEAADHAEQPIDVDSPIRALALQGRRGNVEHGVRVLLKADRAKDAKRVFEQGERAFGTGTMFASSSEPYERGYMLAKIAEGLGQAEQADRGYRAAIEALRARGEVVSEAHSGAQFDDKTAYIANDYIAFLLKHGQEERGLRELERFRAREFHRVLLASAALIGAAHDELAVWRKAQSQVELLLASARPGAEGGAKTREAIASARTSAQSAKARVLQALSETPSSEQQIESLMPAVARKLAANRSTLLVYHMHGKASSVVVLRPGQAPVARALPLRDYQFAPLVGRLSAELESGDVGWQESARALHAALIAPIADLLPRVATGASARPRLGIIPFGDAHRVPFHALTDGSAPLVAQHDVFYMPSLQSFAQGRAASEGVRSVRAIGFNGGRLDYAEAEAQAIDPQARIADAATSDAFFELLAEPGTAHIAAHAELNSDNPLLSMLRFANTELRVHELRGRPMKADIVCLSACDTARGQRLRSDELTGFATTFLENGVRSVIATGWPIDDALTVPLMNDFYAGLRAGQDAVTALSEAQRKALAAGGARAHPKYWAPFWMIGSP